MNAMSVGSRRKAALTIAVKSAGESCLSCAARAGVVLQTMLALLSGSGSRAMGPVGRKRWYAVRRAVDWNDLSRVTVATTPCWP